MIDVLAWLVVFAIGLFSLIKSSDWFVEYSEKLGISLGIPHFVLGLTVVAVGTSLPELAASIIAVLRGSTEVVVSNVVGSNIANVFLILGVVSIFSSRTKFNFKMSKIDLAVFLVSAVFLALTIMDGLFVFEEGVVMLLILAAYLYYRFLNPSNKRDVSSGNKKPFRFKDAFFLVGSSVVIYFGASYSIEALLKLSKIVGISTEVLTVAVLSVGTSLPEMVVSVKSAIKGKTDLAFGNVLGSNVFNVLVVMSVPALIAELKVPGQIILVALPVMLAATAIFIVISKLKRINRWEGFVLLIIYAGFLLKITGII